MSVERVEWPKRKSQQGVYIRHRKGERAAGSFEGEIGNPNTGRDDNCRFRKFRERLLQMRVIGISAFHVITAGGGVASRTHRSQPPIRPLKRVNHLGTRHRVGQSGIGSLLLGQRPHSNHQLQRRSVAERHLGHTHRVPEPESSLDLLHRSLDACEVLLHKCQCAQLGLLDLVERHVLLGDRVTKVERRGVQICLGQNAKPSVDIALERKAWVQVSGATSDPTTRLHSLSIRSMKSSRFRRASPDKSICTVDASNN